MITKSGEKDRTATFIISTDDVDRDKDVIKQDGWQLDNFWKNPILQVHHDNHTFPVGKFSNIYTQDGKTYGTAQFADKGTSEVADLAYDLIQQDILRSVSVGFQGIESEPNDHGGLDYIKQELLEVSLVNVPANQNAQVVAKDYSAETKGIIFKDYETKVSDTADELYEYIELDGSDAVTKAVAIAEEDESKDEPSEAVVAEPEAAVDEDDISDDTMDYIREILNG